MSSPVFPNTRSNLHQSKIEEPRHDYELADGRQYNKSHAHLFVEEVSVLLRSGLRRFPLLRVSLLELRSLVYRIALQCKRRYDLYALDVGPAHQLTIHGHLSRNTRTRACSESIENFLAGRLWATMVDLEMYRDAWVSGANWAESNICSAGHQKSALETSASSPKVIP